MSARITDAQEVACRRPSDGVSGKEIGSRRIAALKTATAFMTQAVIPGSIFRYVATFPFATLLSAVLISAALPSPTLAETGSPSERGYAVASDVASSTDTELVRTTVKVGRGDTLMEVLADADVPRDDAHGVIQALRDVYDPRRLRAGQQVTVLFETGPDGDQRFLGMEIAPDSRRSIRVARGDQEGFTPSDERIVGEMRTAAATGVIESSLFGAGAAAGVPRAALVAFMNVFAHEVDFQRDIQPGDRFHILYETEVAPDGKLLRVGAVRYAALELSGKPMAVYRHAPHGDRADYFDQDGESIRQALLVTPIDGARLTSGFGMRHHPILGYTRMHQGIDFGASTGTPIYAAGDGVIEEAGTKNGYGNYIRIRHNSEIATAYAHMSRFAPGSTRGGRVEQGDVIGYVGSTGRSTGPHLHYEVLKHGRQVNPRSLRMPLGEKLAGKDLERFMEAKAEIDEAFRAALGPAKLVSLPSRNPPPPPRKARLEIPG